MKIRSLIAVALCGMIVATASVPAFAARDYSKLGSKITKADKSDKGVRFQANGSSEKVALKFDREDAVYEEGENIEFTITSSIDGYLYVVNVDSKGNKALLLPNSATPNARITADEPQKHPIGRGSYRVMSDSFGDEKFYVLVSKEKLDSVNGKNLGNVATEIDDVWDSEISAEVEKLGKKAKDKGVIFVDDVSQPDSNTQNDSKPQRSDFATCIARLKTVRKGERSEVMAERKAPKRYAVCLGINDYKNAKLGNRNPHYVPALTTCVDDAEKFANLCIDVLGIPEDCCACYVDDKVTKKNVETLFNNIGEVCEPGSEIFILWSGHGFKGSTTRHAETTFLAPWEADRTEYIDTMISEDEFEHWMQNLGNCKVVFFIDACFSGGMLNNPKDLTTPSKVAPPFEFCFKASTRTKGLEQDDLYVLASSTKQQKSWESGFGTSLMTHFLIETIKNAPSNWTHRDVKEPVKKSVEKEIRENPNKYDEPQTIVDQDNIREPVVLKRTKRSH